jgi:hypothetical protein
VTNIKARTPAKPVADGVVEGEGKRLREFCGLDEPLNPELAEYLDDLGSMGPFVRHPLVYGFAGTPGLLNQKLAAKKEALAEAEAERDWGTFIWLHERPYRLEALLDVRDAADGQEFWDLMGEVWLDSENIWQNLDTWKMLWDEPDSHKVMSEDEAAYLASLPDTVEIYRGICLRHEEMNEDGLSWTVNPERAEWFSRRQANGNPSYVITAEIDKSSIYAYLDHRGEAEVVVDYTEARIMSYKSFD